MEHKETDPENAVQQQSNLTLYFIGFIEFIVFLVVVINISDLLDNMVVLIVMVFAHLLSLLFATWAYKLFLSLREKNRKTGLTRAWISIFIYLLLNVWVLFIAMMAGYSACPSCT